MITYSHQKDPHGIRRHDVDQECWRVVKEDYDNYRLYIVALCPTEDDARRIANALNQMEIES
jgi:5'(3')-deoxyribonucleotidase